MSCSAVHRAAARFGRGVLWLAALAVLAVPLASPGSPISLVHVALSEPAGLRITGDISGLAPGTPARLTLTLHNPAATTASVSHLTTQVTGGTGPCQAAALQVEPWSGRLGIAGRG